MKKNLLLVAFLFVLGSKGFGQQINNMALNGTWDLYNIDESGKISKISSQSMNILTFDNNTFVVQGLSGATYWMGLGKINETSGFFDWRFSDGRFGQTTFTINKEGNLIARSVSYTVDYPYVAKKRIE